MVYKWNTLGLFSFFNWYSLFFMTTNTNNSIDLEPIWHALILLAVILGCNSKEPRNMQNLVRCDNTGCAEVYGSIRPSGCQKRAVIKFYKGWVITALPPSIIVIEDFWLIEEKLDIADIYKKYWILSWRNWCLNRAWQFVVAKET